MSSPGFYFRPGLSVVCVARSARTSAAALRTFLDAHLPHVEQICLAVDDPELMQLAVSAGPKVVCRMLYPACWPAESAADNGQPAEPDAVPAAVTAAQLADHAWSFWLEPHEHLSASDHAAIRAVLPHAGRARLAFAKDEAGNPQGRLWRTGWNLAPGATGLLEPAGPALMRPRRSKMIEQIPVPDVDCAGMLAHSPRVQVGPVLVTGMHRSGTSTVAGVLHQLGIQLGSQLTGVNSQAHESNERGHWEDGPGVALDTKALELVQGFVAPWEWVTDLSVSEVEAQKLHAEEAQAIASRLGARGRWGFKDPRICLTLSIWRQAARDACMVLSVREPLAVARSLRARDALPILDGVRLWRAYYGRALEACAVFGVPVLVVDYARMLTALTPEVNRIATFLGLTGGLDPQCRQRIDDFVDAGLRHHQPASDLREALHREFGAWAVAREVEATAGLYEQLQAAARLPVATQQSAA